MTTFAPRPADVPERLQSLHATVRAWADHIPQTLPYVDLMFAFGFATLGDRGRADSLVEAARKAMVVPIPERWTDNKTYEAVASGVTTNFLFKAFRYRVDQALAGKPHVGPLSDALQAGLEEIAAKGRAGSTANPYLRAEYVIGRMQEWFRLLEPHEWFDVYRFWSKNQDAFQKELCSLADIHDPVELSARIRSLLKDGAPGKAPHEVQLLVLHGAIPLASRVGATFATELIELVPDVLAEAPATPEPPWPMRERELLERALLAADYCARADLVKQLVDAFVALDRSKPEEARFRLANGVMGPAFRSLKKLGMRDEIERLVTTLESELVRGATVADLRARYGANPEQWAAVLQSLVNLAGGWLILGQHEKAAPILDEARNDLLSPAAPRFAPKEYTALAQAYVTALGHGPADSAFERFAEFFQNMDRRKINNTWTTAQYYSRFHLNLVEDVVLAVCSPASEPLVVADIRATPQA